MASPLGYDPSIGFNEEYNLHGIIEFSLKNITTHLMTSPNTSEFMARIRLSDGRIVFNSTWDRTVNFSCKVKSGKLVCQVHCANREEYERFHNPTIRLLFKSTLSILKDCIERIPQEQGETASAYCFSLEKINEKITNNAPDALFCEKYMPGYETSRVYNNIALAGFFNSNPAKPKKAFRPLSHTLLPYQEGERGMITTEKGLTRLGVLKKIKDDNLVFVIYDRVEARKSGKKHNIFSTEVSCSKAGEYTIKALSQTISEVTISPERHHFMVGARSHPLNEVLNTSIYSVKKVNKSFVSLKEILVEKTSRFIGYFDAQKGVLISSTTPTLQVDILSESSSGPSMLMRIPVIFTLTDGVLTSQFDSNLASGPVSLLIRAFSECLEKCVSKLSPEIKANGFNYEDIASVKDEKEIERVVRNAVKKLRHQHAAAINEEMKQRELRHKTRKLSIQQNDSSNKATT